MLSPCRIVPEIRRRPDESAARRPTRENDPDLLSGTGGTGAIAQGNAGPGTAVFPIAAFAALGHTGLRVRTWAAREAQISMRHGKLFPILLAFWMASSCSRSPEKKNPEPPAPVPKSPVNVEQTLASSRAGQRLLPKIKLKRAENALMNGKYEEALQLYEEMGRETQLTAEARSQLFAGQAEALFHLKRFDESVSAWEKVIALRPDDPFSHQNLALVLTEAGRYREAAARLQEVFRIDPDNLPARLDMVNLLKKMGEPEARLAEAARAFDEARRSVDRRLAEALKGEDAETLVRLLGYLVEVPTETVDDASMEALLTHASSGVREKAGLLAARSEKWKKRLQELLGKETDPLVRDVWTRALSPDAGGGETP